MDRRALSLDPPLSPPAALLHFTLLSYYLIYLYLSVGDLVQHLGGDAAPSCSDDQALL